MLFGRFACVRQGDASDCGPACLAAVCLHYGRPVRLQQMRIGTNLVGPRPTVLRRPSGCHRPDSAGRNAGRGITLSEAGKDVEGS